VSVIGIEILRIDVRVVVASVDTYLRFAEACNRLDLEGGRLQNPVMGLPDVVGEITEGARGRPVGELTGAAETFRRAREDGEAERRPRARESAAVSRKEEQE
jgi:hypothetical protein